MTLFKPAAAGASPVDKAENPYLHGRREWNERYGEYIVRERAWRSIAFFALAIAAILGAGLAYVAGQSKVVPYVVEVNKLGDAVAIKRADVARRPDERIIRAQLAGWIQEVRSVYLDAAAEHNAIKDAYTMINQHGSAYAFLNDYMRAPEHNPFERATQQSVSIEVQSVLPVSQSTWRVEWLETERDRSGHEMSHAVWAANLSIVLHPPVDDKGVLSNPVGVFIDSLDWSKRLGSSSP